MFSSRSPGWLVILLGILLAQTAGATPTYFSQFGQNRTHHIEVERLTAFNLTIVGVPQYLVTEWYLNGSLVKTDFAGSPSNRTLFIGGLDNNRTIDAVSYHPTNPAYGDENHIWHVSVFVPEVPQPDLAMEVMQVWPSTVRVGDVLNFSWRVCNQGNAAASATQVKTYISGDWLGNSEIEFIGFISVPAISAGNCSVASNSSWTVTDLGPGTRWLAMHVNANQAIPEPNYANNIDTHSFTFAERLGSLRVTINPAAAVAAGAQWRLGAGSWQNSGSTLHDIPIGTHTISFRSVSGWSRPGNQQVVIQENQLAQLTATYLEQTGSLQVALLPSEAVSAGARWRIRDFSGWMESDSRLDAIPIGNYVVEFRDVAGFFTPADRNVTISDGNVSSISGVYQPASSIQVMLAPQAAVDGGALWRLAGEQSWLPSGASVAGVAAGSHTIEFHPAMGFLTPPSREIAVAEGMLKTVEQSYEVVAGHPLESAEHFRAEINTAKAWAQALLAFASTPDGNDHEFGCRLSNRGESAACLDAANILASERVWQFMRLQRHPLFDSRGEGCYSGWFGCSKTNRDAYFETVEDIQHALLMLVPQIGRFVRTWRMSGGPYSQAFVDGSRIVTYRFNPNAIPGYGPVACVWPENADSGASGSSFSDRQLNLALTASSLYQAFNSRAERLASLVALSAQLGTAEFETTVKAAMAEELASAVLVPPGLNDYDAWSPGTLYNHGFAFQEDIEAQAARLEAVLSEMENLLSAALPSLEGLLISYLPFSFLFDLAKPFQMEAKISAAVQAFRDFAENPMGFNDDCGARETHWQTMAAGWQPINLSDFASLLDGFEFDCQGQACLFYVSPESRDFLSVLQGMIATPPDVVSLTVSQVTASQARARVQVQSQGVPLQAYFQYRAAGGPYLFSPLVSIPANENSAQLTLTELACGADYEVRAYVSHGGGETPSETVNFTTLDCPELLPPAVQTQSASGISQSSATLRASVHPHGAPTSLQFRYGSSQFQMTEHASYGSVGSGNAWSGDLSLSIDGLSCGAEYYFQAMAESVHGQGVGAVEQFSTQACPPGAPAAAIIGTQVQSLTQARVIADVHHNNASTAVEIQLSHAGGSFVSHGSYAGSPISSSEVEPYRINANLTGLECGSSYAVRLRLVNSAGTVTTSSASFQMPACPRTLTVSSEGAASLPIVADPDSASGTTNYSRVLSGGQTVYLTAPPASGLAEFSGWSGCDSVGGSSGRTCAVTMNADREVSAVFAVPSPTASTGSATSIGTQVATLNATVNPNGHATMARFEFGVAGSLDAVTDWIDVGDGLAAQPLSAELAGLSCSSSYQFRVVASYPTGVVAGSTFSFATLPCQPDLLFWSDFAVRADNSSWVVPYALTSTAYSETDDLDQKCKLEFGEAAELADWAVVKAEFAGFASRFADSIGLAPHSGSVWVMRNGNRWRTSARHYMFARHDGDVPGNWAVHDHIDSHTLTLGSWWGTRPALCQTDNTLVYATDFSTDPGLALSLSGNDRGSMFEWRPDSQDLLMSLLDSSSTGPWWAYAATPIFSELTAARSFRVSFRFNPIQPDWGNYPGLHFVRDGGSDIETAEVAWSFVLDCRDSISCSRSTQNTHSRFRYRNGSGYFGLSARLPALDEYYRVEVEYDAATQLSTVSIFRASGELFHESDAFPLMAGSQTGFNRVLFGRASSGPPQYGQTTIVAVDGVEVRQLH